MYRYCTRFVYAQVDTDRMTSDALIAGAGPAGLSLAAALSRHGARVTVVDPAPGAPWPNVYGAWLDDVVGTPAEHAVSRRWDRALVAPTAHSAQRIERTYVTLDRDALKRRLVRDLPASALVSGRVAAVSHSPEGSRVTLQDGRGLHTRMVFDATGHSPALVERGPGEPVGVQVALGLDLVAPDHGLDPDCMVFQDLSTSEDAAPPSFMYALPKGPDHVFVEETVLITDRPLAPEALRGRLLRRLERMGVRWTHVLHVERCCFPMGAPLPPRRQRVVGLGAAAGLVHPASGYSVARSLKLADRIAEGVIGGLTNSPAARAHAAWDTIWTPDAQRTHALHRYGARALIDLDLDGLRAFLTAFFKLPVEVWSSYLSAAATTPDVARAMTRLFVAASPSLKTTLARGGFGRDGVDLVRSLLTA